MQKNKQKKKYNIDHLYQPSIDIRCSARRLTEAPPQKGEEQREEDVAPVQLVLRRDGDHAQEEENQRFRNGAQHLDHVADGGARALRDVFLHIVLHGEGARHDAADEAKMY